LEKVFSVSTKEKSDTAGEYLAHGTENWQNEPTPVENGLNIALADSVLAAVPEGRFEEDAHREWELGC
jgi:hypothetical protein